MKGGETTSTQETVFVAGATGYVGQQVVRQLVARGVRTIAHVRSDSLRLQDWWQRFTELGAEPDATPWKLPMMAETLRQAAPSVVFGLLGTTRARMQALQRTGGEADAASYETVDYGLTAMLVEASFLTGGAPRFTYLSAMGAGPGSKGAYMHWRYKAEQAVITSGLPYTIVRPAIVTGPDRDENRTGERLANSVLEATLNLGKTVGLVGPWRKYRSIDAASLAEAMIRLALSPDGLNRIVERADLDQITRR